MGRDLETIHALGSLVEEWRRSTAVFTLVHELGAELAGGDEPFVGRPFEREHQRERLPAPVVSAWIFVLRPRTRNPAHLHPNSTQYTAVIGGTGTCYVDGEAFELASFDASRVERTFLVFPAGTPHAFEPADEPLVVLSFHTVAPEELVEIEVESGNARRYVGDPRG